MKRAQLNLDRAAYRALILTPTGRGSYVDPRKVSLEDILFSYDRCPAEFIDQPRDTVIAAYRDAQRQIEDALNA